MMEQFVRQPLSPTSAQLYLRGPCQKERFLLLHPDDLPEVLNIFRSPKQIADGLDPPRILSSPKWLWRVLESTGKYLPKHSTIRGMIINSADVTDRKRAEELCRERGALPQSCQSTHDLVQASAPMGIFCLSTVWLNTLGYAEKKCHCWTLFEIIIQFRLSAILPKFVRQEVIAGQAFPHVRIAFVAKMAGQSL
jgi:hypothetical protein